MRRVRVMRAQVIAHANCGAGGFHRFTLAGVYVLIMTFHAYTRATPACAGFFVPRAGCAASGGALALECGKVRFASALTILAVKVFVVVTCFG